MTAAIFVNRFETNPLIEPFAGPGIERNVNGPSVIQVPDWLPEPLGKFYLYFADHKGPAIRLAYADDVRGPWKIHDPGTLQLAQSGFLTEPAPITPEAQRLIKEGALHAHNMEGVPQPLDSATKPHIASPDVHVRQDRHEIVMYYHGLAAFRRQTTRVATSRDGIHFVARSPELAGPYLRVFEHDGMWYGMAMPGIFYRSVDGIEGFQKGPQCFPATMRHCALLKRGHLLHVFWTRVGDVPEQILMSRIDVSGDWQGWQASEPAPVLVPELPYEGADQPLAPSVRDAISIRVNQLRDPAIFEHDGRTYLFYAIAGEAGIAGAEISFDQGTVH
ncbi:MAG: hypothetical protein O2780_19410 [Proteobacteria bacterium]|nr:hypothetical protein [Pseudomonadota bacterium]MDA1301315.1 hypothetical protein [Pseudomonadota bacterium]